MAVMGLFACGKKEKPAEPAAENTTQEITAEMPDTADAKSFAKLLIETEVKDFEPTSGSGAEFEYTSLTFSPNGRWVAEGVVRAQFEEIECREDGTWAIEETESSDTAIMLWKVAKTSCVMREAGAEQRVKMSVFKSGQYKIAFR